MFGSSDSRPLRSIESYRRGDEQVVWIDRFNPTRPRRAAVDRWRYIRQNTYGTLCTVLLAICAVALAIDPTFFRQMIPELKHHQFIMMMVALIACPYAIYVVAQDWRMLTEGETMKIDFMLTDRHFVALWKGSSAPEILSLRHITGWRRDGSDLVLTLDTSDKKGRDDIVRLWDLVDPVAAMSAFQQVLPHAQMRHPEAAA